MTQSSVAITQGTGTPIAIDTANGVDYQQVKMQWGAYGTVTDVAAATPMPVGASSNTTGGASTYAALGGTGNALLTNTAVAVKASAGNLYGLNCYNAGNATAYLQLFDVASGSVTLGTTVPKLSFWVPANGSFDKEFDSEEKIAFLTAITVAATTTATGSSAPATGILANIIYK